MTHIRHTIWLVAAIAVLALAPAAHADYQQAIADCNLDGRLHHQYSQSDIRKAIQNLPTDISEYSDCATVLRAALTGNSHYGGTELPAAPGLITPAGAVAGSQRDLAALKGLHGTPRISVGGHEIVPGEGGLFKLASRTAQNTLPLPLLLSLIAIAVMGALAGMLVLRHRWPETRRVALRILRR